MCFIRLARSIWVAGSHGVSPARTSRPSSAPRIGIMASSLMNPLPPSSARLQRGGFGLISVAPPLSGWTTLSSTSQGAGSSSVSHGGRVSLTGSSPSST